MPAFDIVVGVNGPKAHRELEHSIPDMLNNVNCAEWTSFTAGAGATLSGAETMRSVLSDEGSERLLVLICSDARLREVLCNAYSTRVKSACEII